MSIHDALYWIELGATVAVVLFLLWYYGRFLAPFYRFATTYLGLALLLVLIFAIVYAQVGTSFGIPYLFWHEDFWSRVWAAMGVTLLLGVVGVVAYYLDPYPWETDRTTAAWLAPDEAIKTKLDALYRRAIRLGATRFGRLASRRGAGVVTAIREQPSHFGPLAQAPRPAVAMARAPRAGREVAAPALRWWNYLVFFTNVVFDPLSVSPVQGLIEPMRANQVRLQRFLRTCRTPFLLLLLAPALFPFVFPSVPSVSPTGGLWWPDPPVRDVMSSGLGYYALGVFAWLLGIDLGVLIIKVLIRASEALYAFLPKESEVSAEPGADGVVPPDPQCPLTATGECPGLGCPRGRPSRRPAAPGRHQTIGMLRLLSLALAVVLALHYLLADAAPWLFQWASPLVALLLAANVVGWAFMGRPLAQPWSAIDTPERCRADRLRFVSIAVFVGLFVIVYFVMDHPHWFGIRLVVTPALAICSALSLLAMVMAVVQFLPGWVRLPVVLLLVAWLGYANNDPFKNRFRGMSYAKGDLVDLRNRVNDAYFVAKIGDAHLVPDSEALTNWAKSATSHAAREKPKLVVVAVSGGAARSAYWTAVVLSRLEETIPGFGHHVRVITGASGGMLGTAYYVWYRREVAEGRAFEPHQRLSTGAPAAPTHWLDEIPTNSLQPLARYIALEEIARSLWPSSMETDRGVVLERAWKRIDYPVDWFASLEREGRIPSLVFSPMMIEDGRQLLISNLDLGRGRDGTGLPTVMTQGRHISYNGDGKALMDVSLPAIELFRIFPGTRKTFLLSTAVRMNASFPYVSPAVNLPADPPRRVVDAGYYDNYGIQVASAWIRQNREDLRRLTSGVLLVQIRDSSGDRERLDVDDAPPTAWARALRGFDFVSSPIDGFLEARTTVSSFRNDADVEALNGPFAPDQAGDVPDSKGFFRTIIFENSADVSFEEDDLPATPAGPADDPFWRELSRLQTDDGPQLQPVREVSMTWYLTRAEQAAIRRAIPRDPPSTSEWHKPSERRAMLKLLAGQVFNTRSKAELAPMTEQQKQELRKNGELCFEPGPARDVRFKRLEQLRNYEQLQGLKTWWSRPRLRP